MLEPTRPFVSRNQILAATKVYQLVLVLAISGSLRTKSFPQRALIEILPTRSILVTTQKWADFISRLCITY